MAHPMTSSINQPSIPQMPHFGTRSADRPRRAIGELPTHRLSRYAATTKLFFGTIHISTVTFLGRLCAANVFSKSASATGPSRKNWPRAERFSPVSISLRIQSPWSIIDCARTGSPEKPLRATFSLRPWQTAVSIRSSPSVYCTTPEISAQPSRPATACSPRRSPHRHGVLRLLLSPDVEATGADNSSFHPGAART